MIVVCMMIFPYIIYNRLPEIIPSHINVRGEFDGYGNKDGFYALPLSGLLIYIGLSIMQRYPHAFNYPIGVTEDNYHKLYSLGVKCVRFCKTTCVLIFAYYTYKFVLAALGLTITSFPVIILFIGLMFGMIYYFVKMSKCWFFLSQQTTGNRLYPLFEVSTFFNNNWKKVVILCLRERL